MNLYTRNILTSLHIIEVNEKTKKKVLSFYSELSLSLKRYQSEQPTIPMSHNIVSLDNVYANRLGTFIKLTNSVLPVQYPDSFFQEIVHSKNGKDTFFAQLAFYSEVVVGAVKAKLIANKKGGILPHGVYIEILAVLEHYSGKGIGTKMLEYVESEAKRHYQHALYVHVASDNVHALTWYKKRGFDQDGDVLIEYYKNTNGSANAVVLKKTL